MRKLMAAWLVLACIALATTGCGGGGGSGDGGAGLNAYEQALVGDYVLDGFDVQIGGVWYDETDFASWAGTLSLYGNRTFAYSLAIEGLSTDRSGVWSATAITFHDGVTTAPYTFDGTDFVTDYTDTSTGDREIQRWRRLP